LVASPGAFTWCPKVSNVLDGYSAGARGVVSLATAEARQLGHPRVGTEHLLLGLLADADSDTAAALRAAGATLAGARYTVSEVVTDVVESPGGDEPPFTPRAQRALERAGRFARRDKDPEVTADHVLLGVLDVEGLACQVMRGLGVDLVRLRESIVGTELDDAPAVDAQPELQVSAPAIRPRCPHCATELDGNLIETIVSAQRDGQSTTNVSIVYCVACGSALGLLRSEPA
jgi:ATP-dependent Clp protease ATP-binding subunit ClpA